MKLNRLFSAFNRAEPAPFTDEQVHLFNEQGFLVIDLDIDTGLLDEIVEVLSTGQDKEDSDGARYVSGLRVQDAWKTHLCVRKLATMPKVLGGLRQLFGRKALPFQTLNFSKGTQQPTHSDTIHFNSMPSGFMAGVWVALEPMDADNGPLVYYPGSHRQPEYSMQDCGLETGYANYRGYERFIQNQIDELGLQPEYGHIDKGQALIWHANLWHGGSRQVDKSRSRHSQVTHYYFEGCRYYTPMNSTENEVAYRKPNWISSVR